MTAAPPPRDSVLDALGYGIRVLTKPEFLWAPFILYVILLLPLLAVPGMTSTPPRLTTPEEVDAFFRAFIPALVGSLVLGIVLGPVVTAVMYRLAQQFIDGEPAAPFASGIVGLAWRYFLQTLAFVLLAGLGSFAAVLAFFAIDAIASTGLAVLISSLGGFVGLLYIFFRVGLAPVLLLWGDGPLQAIGRSWELTRGHVLQVVRWLVVSGVIVGILGAVVSGVVSAIFGTFGQPAVGQYLGTLLIAPVGLVNSIVLVLLARLLMSPAQSAPPPPALPDWMNQGSPAQEPPTLPPPDGGQEPENGPTRP